jgi:hypothetical protein
VGQKTKEPRNSRETATTDSSQFHAGRYCFDAGISGFPPCGICSDDQKVQAAAFGRVLAAACWSDKLAAVINCRRDSISAMQHNQGLIGLIALITAYQLWISLRLARAPQYEARQKWLQIALIWAIPVLGCIVVQAMMWQEGRPPRKPEKGYTEPGGNGG